jgi:CheY-like chemotaxis protein
MNAQRLNKVLVVDDDPVVGKSFVRVLSSKGYAVVTACDGEEALRKIASEDYDAVFTDIKMPGIDGISVAEQIRAQRPWLPVVIVSGYATVENEARAKAAGVCAVLHKPLSPQMIEQGALDAMRERPALSLAAQPAAPAPVTAPQATHAAAEATKAVGPDAGPPLWLVPFFTLAYLVLAPFVGLVSLVAIPVWYFAKWLVAPKTKRFSAGRHDVALLFAVPFVGLAYILALPFFGLCAIAWFGFKAVFTKLGRN